MSESLPLIVHVVYSLSTGGLENGLVNIINRSPKNRYRHVIVCITTADEFANRITADNVKVIELHKKEGRDLGYYSRVWRLFRELNPDVIHSRNLAALETQLFSLGCNSVKRVHGEHGREFFDLDGTNWKYLTFRRFMRFFIDSYIAVSRDIESWLVEKVNVAPEKVQQIYNGVDHALFSPNSGSIASALPTDWRSVENLLVVGTVGRLSPVKGQRTLLAAMAQIRDVDPLLFSRVRVLVVGDGPLREDLMQRVDQLGLADNVLLVGDRDDVPELLQVMDVFVLPSLAEGISNTVLEAMSSGLPVVASSVGGNLELVTEGFNGSLVPADNPEKLAHALLSLLNSRESRMDQGARARQWVSEDFDWNRTVESYLGVYDRLLQVSTTNNLRVEG